MITDSIKNTRDMEQWRVANKLMIINAVCYVVHHVDQLDACAVEMKIFYASLQLDPAVHKTCNCVNEIIADPIKILLISVLSIGNILFP